MVTIFWGSGWLAEELTASAASLNAFFDFVLTSPLLDLLSEYSVSGKVIGHETRIASVTITDSDPLELETDAQIRAAIAGFIAAKQVPPPGPNTLYFVYLPPGHGITKQSIKGTESSCMDFCGYHGASFPYYAVVPYADCDPCTYGSILDSLTVISSHELCEAITDPEGTGWFDDVGEIGDVCSPKTDSLGDFKVQKMWSNVAGDCVASPCGHFQSFSLEAATPIGVADARNFVFAVGDFNNDGHADLFCIKVRNTGTGRVEVHVLDGAANFQSFVLQTGTPILLSDSRNFVFGLGDFNGDGIADLYALKVRNTGSGTLEVHVLDGASGFQQFLVQTGTPIIQADIGNFVFGLGGSNPAFLPSFPAPAAEGFPNLYALKVRNTGTESLEVHILAGATNFQTYLLQTGTPIEAADVRNFIFGLGDFHDDDNVPDVYGLKFRNTGTGKLEVHLLDGSKNFLQFEFQAGTRIVGADIHNFVFGVGDFNGDETADLYAIKVRNTGSGYVEVHVINGANVC